MERPNVKNYNDINEYNVALEDYINYLENLLDEVIKILKFDDE